MAEVSHSFGVCLTYIYNILNIINTSFAHRFLLWCSRLALSWNRVKYSITANIEDLPQNGQISHIELK